MESAPAAPPIGRIRRVLATTALVTAGFGLGLSAGGMPGDLMLTALGFVGYITAGLAVGAEARRVGAALPPVGDLRITRRRAGQLTAITIGTFALSLAGLYLSLVVLSIPFEDWVTTTFIRPDDADVLPSGLVHRALFAIEAVALAPIVEELVFRGVMLHWWSRTLGLRRAVLVSALMFGALHFDPLGSTLFALVATALYMGTGTMLAPIVFHAMWNCTVTIVTAASAGASEQDTLAAFRAGWPMALAVLLAAALVLSRGLRSLRPADGWRLPSLE